MKSLSNKLPFIAIFFLCTACRVGESSAEPFQVVKVEDKYEVKLPTLLLTKTTFMSKLVWNMVIERLIFL